MDTGAPRSRDVPPPHPVPASPHAVFGWCPMCDGALSPEHAHYRCTACGWRDSCCD